MTQQYAALASGTIAVQEEERKRIARDLHDDVGQQITVLQLKLEELMALSSSPALDTGFRELRDLMTKLDERLHFVAAELRPAALDLGIVTALEQFVKKWSATFEIDAVFHTSGMDRLRLPPDTETHIYRIAIEALNNVAKHSGARHVTVLVERRDQKAVLVVEDDGRGFEAGDARGERSGLGLVGMRERAQIIKGQLEIETSPDGGTSVLLSVPGEVLRSS